MTNFVVDGNSTGKTKKLLYFAKDNNAIVVCKNPSGMKRKAEAYGIFGLDFYSYSDAFNLLDEGFTNNYVIDEVADFINLYFSGVGQLIGFTQTQEG